MTFEPLKPAHKSFLKSIAPNAPCAIDSLADAEARLDLRNEIGVVARGY